MAALMEVLGNQDIVCHMLNVRSLALLTGLSKRMRELMRPALNAALLTMSGHDHYHYRYGESRVRPFCGFEHIIWTDAKFSSFAAVLQRASQPCSAAAAALSAVRFSAGIPRAPQRSF